MQENTLDQYLKGKKLYGDSFTLNQIKEWYEDEKNGYFDLDGGSKKNSYSYHALNKLHGYKYLKKKLFKNVLSIGGAYGEELIPLLDQIENITILEPSTRFHQQELKGKKINYIEPNDSGKMPFSDNSFDLITCYGVLHHIPNVSFVISEMQRVLKSKGYILLREPFVSMGDWRKPRPGLTKRERGIPLKIMDNIIEKNHFKIVRKKQCINIFSSALIQFGKVPVFSKNFFTILDSLFSSLFSWNKIYFRDKTIKKFGNSSVFYILEK